MVVSELRSPEDVRWIVVKRHLSASTQSTERPFFTVAVGVKAGYFGPGYSLLRRPNVVHLIDHSVDTGRKNISIRALQPTASCSLRRPSGRGMFHDARKQPSIKLELAQARRINCVILLRRAPAALAYNGIFEQLAQLEGGAAICLLGVLPYNHTNVLSADEIIGIAH